MMNPCIDHYLDQFSRLTDVLPGHGLPWLARLRRDAIERFAHSGLPTLRDEDWKYTSLRTIETKRFNAAAPGTRLALTVAGLAHLVLPDAHQLVFVDGRFRPTLSYAGQLPKGVILTGLAGILADPPEALATLLAEDDAGGFEALNTAFMADGAYLFLPPGTTLSVPIQFLFITGTSDLAVQPRNLIVAGEGSRACVVEHHLGIDGCQYLTNALTRIVVGAGARVEHHKLQQESLGAAHIATVRAEQAPDSRFISGSIALGGALARVGIDVSLKAAGASCELVGLYVADGRQHTDHHTRVDHLKPSGTSREYYRGVLAGDARAVFNGKVVVHPDAQHSDAFQSNHNLLLSDSAEVDTKPELEIYADDVKCGHGATVGQIDADQVFYLRSRGVGEDAARALLTMAFTRDIIDRIRTTSLRQRVEQLVQQRLPAMEEG
jgi:Fe-S cluster assembly protein SufD